MTAGAAVSVDPVTETLPVVPGRVHCGATSAAGGVVGQPLASGSGAASVVVAMSTTDDALVAAGSESEPQAARATDSAATAAEVHTREKFTRATVQARPGSFDSGTATVVGVYSFWRTAADLRGATHP
ncbi:hypothetical protein MMUR_36080 [Mycolicibacterium murale]|uniref:Uncharacterized protein n=1 Tax=Mycolicibacterium murale TaxID=182220 RepID=A0A7I9WNZ8_9MYCO|nr:hypothetical protein MMUR_36080 [Mycolicibacterium murale]